MSKAIPIGPKPVDLSVNQVDEDPAQPRRFFRADPGFEASIQVHGVLEPVVVVPAGDRYRLVFGARRTRAARKAGLKTIPAIIRTDLSPAQILELQLVENIQREGLHEVERAESVQRLHERPPAGFGYTAEQIAERLGVSRSTVYGLLKLTALLQPAREAFLRGELDQSKALLVARHKAEAQELALKVATRRARGELPSYRQVEAALRRTFGPARAREERPARAGGGDLEGQERRARAVAALMARVAEGLERKVSLDTPELRTMALALLGWSGEAVAARRGEGMEQLAAAVRGKSTGAAQLRALVFELAITPWLGSVEEDYTAEVKALAKGFGVSLRDLEEASRPEEERARAEALFVKARSG